MIIYCAQKTSDLFIVLLFSNQVFGRETMKNFFKKLWNRLMIILLVYLLDETFWDLKQLAT